MHHPLSLLIPDSSVCHFCNNGWYRYIKGYLRHRSPQTRLSHCRSGKALWFPFVNSCLVPLMKNDGWAAQSSELDNKSPHYIELSASPALVPVCIRFSLSLQLSAWSGTVNDGFVLCSPCIKLIFFQKSINKFGIYSIAVRQIKGSMCCPGRCFRMRAELSLFRMNNELSYLMKDLLGLWTD